MKIAFIRCLFVSVLISHTASFAFTCPSVATIKSTTLISASRNPNDPTCWSFYSTHFMHDGKEWNVDFGSFFPDAKTEKEALQQGQKYFAQAQIVIKHPRPDHIPNNVILCDYMPTGRAYWISAVTPPEQSPVFR